MGDLREEGHTPIITSNTSDLTDMRVDVERTNRNVAIIGMSGRFPGADSVSKLWRILSDARDLHQTVSHSLYTMMFTEEETVDTKRPF